MKILVRGILLSTLLLLNPLSHAENSLDAGVSHSLFKEAMTDLLGSNGKTKSAKTAFKKFETLANQGWKTAQLMLGNMYAKGEGTHQNQVQAYLWYSLAAEQNFFLAEQKRTSLVNKLNADQLQQAELLIQSWKKN